MMLFDDFVADSAPDRPRLPTPDIPGQHVLLLPLSAATRGVLLTVRGTGQDCRMILRTRAMQKGQGYFARFAAPSGWQTLNLPLADFHPQGVVLRRQPRPEVLHGYAIQSDTAAELNIAKVSFY